MTTITASIIRHYLNRKTEVGGSEPCAPQAITLTSPSDDDDTSAVARQVLVKLAANDVMIQADLADFDDLGYDNDGSTYEDGEVLIVEIGGRTGSNTTVEYEIRLTPACGVLARQRVAGSHPVREWRRRLCWSYRSWRGVYRRRAGRFAASVDHFGGTCDP